MSANILDGRLVAHQLQEALCEQVQQRTAGGLTAPGLAVILVGADPASKIYVDKKRTTCEKIGFFSKAYDLPESTDEQTLLNLIHELNNNNDIDGILVQLPLPNHIDSNLILEQINPNKDVDGFHPYNLGRLIQKRPLLRPCTPYGIMLLLQYYQIDVKKLDAVMIGASNIVGRPMALELLLAGASVTVCHRFTQNISEHIKKAEILIVAIGKPGIIDSQSIKPGAIVIDVGMNRLANGSIVGDIDFDTAKERAAWITPVPGGVGPMTVTTLMKNTLYAAEKRLTP